MALLDAWSGPCPHCGEPNTFEIDRTAGRHQAWIEDCWVCCRPIQVRVHLANGDGLTVSLEPSE
jgi:hypothetical protein